MNKIEGTSKQILNSVVINKSTFFFIKHGQKTKHECSTDSSKESSPVIPHGKICCSYLNTEQHTYRITKLLISVGIMILNNNPHMFNNNIYLFIVFSKNGFTGKTATAKHRFFKKEPTENLILAKCK